MNILFQAAKEIADFMSAKHWHYCIIGGLAVMRWGEPRTTQDVDLTLMTGFGDEARYVDILLDSFATRGTNPKALALQSRILLLNSANGVGLDVALAGFPFEEEMLQRASPFCFAPDCEILTCSAEDLVVSKAFADRPKDWLDVEGILLRQQKGIKSDLILSLLEPLCEAKESPEIMARMKRLLRTTQ